MNPEDRLQKITPQSLSTSINLDFSDTDWVYKKDSGNTISQIQAEGAAKLWNMLLDKKIALLADEVGMGKTIQALSVMATLWQQKGDAKVLLYAPNENVAQKWIREYNNFIRYHYRHADNLVKSAINGMPLRKAMYCENHLQLLEMVNKKWPSFFVCKTSSLSGFMSPRLTREALQDLGLGHLSRPDEKTATEEEVMYWMYEFGTACNERIHKLISSNGEPPFDLIIFDEAHYLRRADGDSNRSMAAHAFFAGRNIRSFKPYSTFAPLAKKVLLLTATPNHSSKDDIRSITGLFQPEYRLKEPADILREICVRRFRRLANKTKHDYREEIASPVHMEHLSERLFFAAYHKALVKTKSEDRNRSKSKVDNPYRVLFGYLEGFEFLPREFKPPTRQQKKQVEGTDFHQRDDSKVIVDLSNLYFKAYKERPEHPKYRKIMESLIPEHETEQIVAKKLVFVRRIASVYEISHRVNDLYDAMLERHIIKHLSPLQINEYRKKPRAFFHQLANGDSDPEELTEDPILEVEEKKMDTVGESKVLSLFTVKKDGRLRSTDCSNFRLRFLKKETIFSFFFEPPSDYRQGEYLCEVVLLNDQGKRDYKMTAQAIRLANKSMPENQRILLESHFYINTAGERTQGLATSVTTLMNIWLRFQIRIPENLGTLTHARIEYQSFSNFEKEGFSSFIEKGILFASEHIARFYGMYRTIVQSEVLRGEELYNGFCQRIEESIESSGLALLICKAVNAFRIFYKKELGHTEEALLNESWNFLNNTLPAFPVSGETNRDSIRKAFNTPFYPNVLIATSVLQEGVDLHYQCAEVIHYGIAWTQGDNEQRVGRVDRMFGKMEYDLAHKSNATLPIHYPYLKNTIDQDQVARFITRKHESEKLLDRLRNVEFNNEINFREETSNDVWSKYLNKPGKYTFESDPFPVDYGFDFANISTPRLKKVEMIDQVEGFLTPLLNSIHEHYKHEFVLLEKQSQHSEDKRLFAIRHVRLNMRHQPIIGEFGYSEEGFHFLQRPVFYIRILTPLAKTARNLDSINRFKLLKEAYRDNPLLKICLDRHGKDVMKYYVSADLPLFILEDGKYNLSHEEVIDVINSVIEFSDELEQIISNKDIPNDSVISSATRGTKTDHKLFLAANRNITVEDNWTVTQSGRFVYQEIAERFQSYDDLYTFNHNNLYLRKILENRVTKKQVGIYRNDALKQECNLLEKLLTASID